MMKLKRILYIFLLTILLAACGPAATPAPVAEESAAPPTEEAAAPVAEEAAAPPAEEAEGVSLQILGPWLATEADAFELVLDGFRESSGIDVVYEGSPDMLGPLTTKVAAGEPPDLAIIPVAKGMRDLVAQDALIPLDPFADEIAANISDGWTDQFTIDGKIYAIPTRANINDCLWFNPEVVDTPPTSWSELIAYCDSVVAEGGGCVAGTGKDVWPLNLLFQSVYKATYGLDKWNALLTREIPFNDPTVVEVFNRIASLYSDDYAAGGSVGALGTGLVDGIARVFGTSPDAHFVNAGSWGGGIAIGAVNENLVEGETIDYIIFPGEPAGEGTILGSADVAVMLVDNPEARELMSYLISPEGQARFAPSGYTVANMNVDPSLYTGLTAKTSQLLAESDVGPDISALLPNDFVSQLNEAVGAAILDPGSIETILDNLEANFGK